MHDASNPRQNHLLAALPPADLDRLMPDLQAIWMNPGEVIHEPGDAPAHAYFPTTAIVSLLYLTADGGSAEVAVVGNDGMVGLAIFMGGDTMPNRAVVLTAGHAYRLHRPLLKLAVNRVGGRRQGAFSQLLLRYTQSLVTQMAQTAVCNRHHTIAQQLCRWLLLSIDRSVGNEVQMTQELIATMLGVRREGITTAAHQLQRDGLIHYRRGQITILDRAGLEARVCECYGVVRREYERLLPRGAAWSAA